jgi:hypothetical protein
VSDAIDEVLLGSDWLRKNECVWNFATSEIVIRGHTFKLQTHKSVTHVHEFILRKM